MKTMNKIMYALVVSMFMIIAIGTSVEAKTAPKPATKKHVIVKVVKKPAIKTVVKKTPELTMRTSHAVLSNSSVCEVIAHSSGGAWQGMEFNSTMTVFVCYDGTHVWEDQSFVPTCTTDSAYTAYAPLYCGSPVNPTEGLISSDPQYADNTTSITLRLSYLDSLDSPHLTITHDIEIDKDGRVAYGSSASNSGQ